MTESNPDIEISRRRLLGTVGAAGAAGLALGATGGALVHSALADSPAGAAGAAGGLASLGANQVAFHGDHQAGITTPSRPRATSSPSTWPPGPAARRPPP